MTSEAKALFIPLKAVYFEQFLLGEKTIEYRKYGPRWNEHTCFAGRKVLLSRGYGKQYRLRGEITKVKLVAPTNDFIKIYGEGQQCLAISIKRGVEVQGQ